MSDLDQATQAAKQLRTARDTAKFILGDRYEHHMKDIKVMLMNIADSTGKDVLSAAIDYSQGLDALPKIIALAAAVELVESTPAHTGAHSSLRAGLYTNNAP